MRQAPTDWDPDRIRKAIHAHGISMEALAVEHGYSSSVVRAALIRRSAAGEKLISNLLGVPVQEIWPSRYDATGRSTAQPKRMPQSRRMVADPQRQIGSRA